MRIRTNEAVSPRSSASVKRLLISLNRDLDKLKSRIEDNRDYDWWRHSITTKSTEISPVEATILYLEDRRFFNHRGIELRAIPRTVRRLTKGKRIGAISTIDQQVVRICTNRRERTFRRKARELFLAYALNFHCSKKEILDYYIHYCYLGYKLEGVEIAAQSLFGIRARDLNWEQSALVASLLPLPMPSTVYLTGREIAKAGARGESYIDLGEKVSPRWASRVRFRYNEALKAQEFMANILFRR
ncbi:biosynthetic peptidoglycan transglycosylase [Rhodobacteraceae bacterium PD-2]|uniref:Glycosyl transferase family 51 domain-containing protein n=1 Tax=Ponticoccus alexandrii TaxID=1943633 RepID=A0ABX7F4P8_9RHOB|nr:hypothetical protein GQA70_03735 [Ponticoccus alexandrii]